MGSIQPATGTSPEVLNARSSQRAQVEGSLNQLLPVELINAIAKCILKNAETRIPLNRPPKSRSLLRTSIVCRAWSETLRRFLFHVLSLRTVAGVDFLLDILRSRTSSWLAPHILDITMPPGDSQAGIDYGSSRLLKSLTALQVVQYSPNNELARPFPVALQPRLSQLRSVRTFFLRRAVFSSPSGLLRLLAAIPSLEKAYLHALEWQSPRDAEQPPDCAATFNHMRDLYCDSDDGIVVWPVAWAMAAGCTRTPA